MKPSSTISPERAGVTWGYFFSIVGLIIIFYTTLFPFDFVFSNQNSNFDFNLIKSNAEFDYVRNILLFVPLSFGLSQLLSRRRKNHYQIVFVVVFLVGAGLSTMVEILQLFVSSRESTLTDILTNTIGTVCGFLIFHFLGEKLISFLSQLSVKLLAAIFILYYMALALAFLSSSKAIGLNNWDSTFPLILGNELTGDRSWQGTISNLQITDYPISEQEIKRVLRGEIADSLMAFYPLNSVTTLSDQTRQQPNLIWHSVPPAKDLHMGVPLDAEHWLLSRMPATKLSRRFAHSSQFTLSLLVTTANKFQTGPARIVSLSADIFHRNLTIGQDGSDLIIRLRTPATGENGIRPELDIPDVFADNQSHHLIIIYDGATLNVYIDTLDRFYSYALAPQITFTRYLSPLGNWRIRINSDFLLIYRVFNYVLIFFPIGYLLYLKVAYMSRRTEDIDNK